MSLLVSEIFGPTFQGEGRHAGQLASFLRLGGCNLHCSWCDTPYTWAFGNTAQYHRSKIEYDQKQELRWMTIDESIDSLVSLGLTGMPRLVITGGEPLLQSRGLVELLSNLRGSRLFRGIDIETAGTKFPVPYHASDTYPVYYTVSPKLESSGNSLEKRRVVSVLSEFVELSRDGRADFKFVVVSEEDLNEIEEMQNQLLIPASKIWLMPEGTASVEISEGLKRVASIALDRGYNISSRLHVEIWGNKRGV